MKTEEKAADDKEKHVVCCFLCHEELCEKHAAGTD